MTHGREAYDAAMRHADFEQDQEFTDAIVAADEAGDLTTHYEFDDSPCYLGLWHVGDCPTEGATP